MYKICLYIGMVLIFTLSSFSQIKQTIVVPPVNIPGYYLPAITIPSREIPEKTTSYGTIPSVSIPAIEIPAIYVQPINTEKQIIKIPEYSKIYETEILNYKKKKSQHPPNYAEPKYSPMTIKERNDAYIRYSQFVNEKMLKLFSEADIDNSMTLSWRELHLFQKKIKTKFSYKVNQIALRPDNFIDEGGGDCEDWALLTSAFCRYWGWEAYVAGFFDDEVGHAIAMVKSPLPVPDYYFSWYLSNKYTVKGDYVPNGTYVPVDYEYVGGFSSAMSAGMILKYIMTPERIYGTAL